MERSLVLILALRSGFLGMIPFRMSPERKKQQMCHQTQLTFCNDQILAKQNHKK
jgi:hypothetical protein